MAKSNPIGKGTRNLVGNAPVEVFVGIKKLANLSGISPSRYLRALAEFAVAHQLLAKHNTEDEHAWEQALMAGADSPPEVRIEIVFPLSVKADRGKPLNLNECPTPEPKKTETSPHAPVVPTGATIGTDSEKKTPRTFSTPGPTGMPAKAARQKLAQKLAVQAIVDADRKKRGR